MIDRDSLINALDIAIHPDQQTTPNGYCTDRVVVEPESLKEVLATIIELLPKITGE